ncbi:MAG: autotransporter-associated beta strand repeat-containing protein, partial [Phycisphaerales bacterium]|nr:autotransporter-associated beta strand repeat-containing protein [Phycisphaerales bacterium]
MSSHTIHVNRFFKKYALLGAAAVMAASQAASAATWLGNDGENPFYWDTTSKNWTTGAAPDFPAGIWVNASGSAARFTGTPTQVIYKGTGPANVNAGHVQVGSIYVSDGNWHIESEGGVIWNGAGNWIGFEIASGSSLTFDAVIADNPQNSNHRPFVRVVGPGTLTLTADNTFGGNIQINSGTLRVSKDSNLGIGYNYGYTYSRILMGGMHFIATDSFELNEARNIILNGGTTISATGTNLLIFNGVV